ncbi:MAG: DUF1801 domain-containing protein [Phycisphaerales bacterium]|nr:DUF1801 domain-containing protein [Phycisphaerales bacterium]
MQSKATTVDQYLAELPEDRRATMIALRQVFLEKLPEGYVEGMAYGMIGYHVPHSTYPAGYHCDPRQPLPFAGLAAQKNHYSLYLFCIYGSQEFTARFRERWEATGRKLDMGKGCVRFKRLEDVPLEVVGEAIGSVPVDTFIALYEQNLRGAARTKAASARASSDKPRAASKKAVSNAFRKTSKKMAKKSALKKAAKKTGGKTSGRNTLTARAGKAAKSARSASRKKVTKRASKGR